MKSMGSEAAVINNLPAQQPNEAEYLNYVQDRRSGATVAPGVGEIVTPVDDMGFLAADEKLLRLKDVVRQIAGANVPVLISGESGTGKEVFAQAIHKASSRKDKPFVAINCAAIPANLLESELFGYEKGAFTNASQRHIGKFEQANGGTLLLDEVTEIDPALQAKLLRALQEREIERLGGSGPVPVDVRIIATTNRDIVNAVSTGMFRQDLYYRLYVIHMEIPPLRERAKDIELLAHSFLDRQGAESGRKMQFSRDALNKLQSYPWPGNVRELQNVVQRTVLMTKADTITASDLRLSTERSPMTTDWIKALPVGRSLQEVETQFILETLKYHRGNRTHAAKTLGISLRTLRNKINEFTSVGIDVMTPQTGKPL